MELKVMKAKILVLGLVLGTVGAVVLYPSLRGNAIGNPPPVDTVITPAGSAKVEVVFVLDTTGSMSGLIAAAKEKIWSIATTLSQANPAPEISIGLVAYRDRGDDYVTKVVDLSKDLDSMYATLMDVAAGGGGDGPESVNQALYDAIHGVSWSQDQSTYKVVFLVGDAPPHMDYQDDVKYPQIVAAAAARGIVVNTIQCGSSSETVAPWQQIAALGHGRYFTVEQAGGAIAIATPFDAEIATLAAELDATRLYYGSEDERRAMDAKIAATDRLRESASTAALARRGVFNATESGAANLAGDHDLVADVASGRVDVAAVPPAQLPEPLVGLTAAEQHELIEETAQRRRELQTRINELASERDAFIEQKVEESGGAAASLDGQIYEAVRDQAAEKGLSYESGPKF
jgi:Mg-chelatase subunit ChlD